MEKKHGPTKRSNQAKAARKGWTVGIDLGDQWSRHCVLDQEGEAIEEGRLKTTPEAVRKHFAGSESMRIAIEAGTHSLWVSEDLRQFGHEVLVANAREVRAITHSDSKSDQLDAEKLARYARVDPKILHPITHRGMEMQRSLNEPLLKQIELATAQIALCDKRIEELARRSSSRDKGPPTDSWSGRSDSPHVCAHSGGQTALPAQP